MMPEEITIPADDVITVVQLLYKYTKYGGKGKRYGLSEKYFGDFDPKAMASVLKNIEALGLIYEVYYHGNRYWKLTRKGRKLAVLLEVL